MAGSYSANGRGLDSGAYLYARVEATVVDTNATTCTVTVSAIVVSDTGSSSFIRGRATSNSSGGYGAWSDYKSVSYNGRTTCATQTFTVARGDSAKTMTVHANLEGGGTGMYAGTSDTASVSIAIPPIPYETPNAPSGCSATRASRTSATISWTNGATTTTKNRTAVILERRTDSGAFSQIASLGASSTSYTDTLIAADHTYVYRVKSRGKGGDSGYATSGTVPLSYEAPNAPTNCKATRNSRTKATVTWTNGATTTLKNRTAVLLERKTDSGGFSQIASLAAGTTSYTDNNIAADHSYTYRVRSQGNGGYSGYATSSAIPLAYEVPNAPSGCSASRTSDTKATVSWTNGATTTLKTRTAVLIERAVDGGGFAQIGSLGASVSSYTDNSISANHRYAYRVRSQGNGGYSGYATSGYIYTTPAAPTAVSVEKTAATTLRIGATVNAPYATGYDVAITYNSGSTWTTLASNTSLPYTTTVSGGTVRIRVRSVRGSLSSAWTLSASLVTICPPLAPTIVQAPANPMAYGDSSTITWTPNHPDGSAQSATEVKVTNPGGTSTTYSVSTATSYSFTPNATGTWTAQVRTKGLDPDWGEWSQTVSWSVYNPPMVVITSPATDGTDIVALPLKVAWTVTDSTGVSAQRIIIEGDGGEILNRTLAGDVRTVALNASDVALENGQTYTIRLRVMGGSGLVTEQTRIFDVAWLAPATPVLQLTEGEGRSATIDVMDTHYSESGATISVDGSAIADSFTVYGKSTQDGTPTPSAPVPIRSVEPYNLLDLGEITFTRFKKVELGETFPTGQYVFSADINTDYTGVTFRVLFYNGNAEAGVWYLIATNGRISGQVHPTSSFDGIGLYAGYNYSEADGHTATYTNIQLEVGGTEHRYQPKGEIAIRINGKNLFDKDNPNAIAAYVTSAGAMVSSTSNLSAVIPVIGGETYTVSGTKVQLSGTSADDWACAAFQVRPAAGSQGTVLFYNKYNSNGTMPQTFTVPSNCSYIALKYANTAKVDATATAATIQLELGSTATEYEPYTDASVFIPLQGNSLRSLPDGTRDELRVGERKVLVKRCEETLQAVTDGVTGTVGVDVLSATGEIANDAQVVYKLAAPQEIDLGAVFDLPFIPEDGEMWVDGTEMEAVLRPADYAWQPPIQSVDVQRVNADGTAWTVATGLTMGGSCIDPLPPLGVPVTYRATSSAASGSTASGEFTETFGGRDWVLNFGQSAELSLTLRYGPRGSRSLTHGGALYHFARGGKGLPVWYGTRDRDEGNSYSFKAVGKEDADRLFELSYEHPVGWLRDQYGHRWYGHMSPSVSYDSGMLFSIDIALDATQFMEAW